MNTKQKGFTLIELVVVLVLLGILAATAVPRFQNLSDDARTASAQAILGALLSSAGIAIAQTSGQASTLAAIVAATDITTTGDVVTVESDGATPGPEEIGNGLVTTVECGTAGADTQLTINVCPSGTAAASCTGVVTTATATMSNALCQD